VQKDSTGFWMQDTARRRHPQMSDAIFVSRNSGVALPSRGNLVRCAAWCRIMPHPHYLTTKRLACVSSITVLAPIMAMPNIARFRGPGPISLLPRRHITWRRECWSLHATTIVGPVFATAFFPSATNARSGLRNNMVSMTESLAPNVVDYNPEFC